MTEATAEAPAAHAGTPAAHGQTHEGTEVPGGAHHAGFPPFDGSYFPTQLIWLAISFGLLYILMSRIALPRIGGILEQRRNRIATDLDAARALQEQSSAAISSYEASLASARANAQSIAAEGAATVAAEVETTRKGLESALGKRLAEAESSIQATKTAALSNVRSIAEETTIAIVERLSGGKTDAKALKSALDAALGS